MKKAIALSFLFSLVYVGGGSVAILFIRSPAEWVPLLVLVTLPVNIVSFGILYMDADSLYLVALIQLLILGLVWKYTYRVISNRADRLKF